MKVVLTRVKKASVIVDNEIIGEIGQGLLALCGYDKWDEEKDLIWMLEKCSNLRIFSDENGKMNLSASKLNLPILVISQFTLLADCRKGNRPSFIGAGDPSKAEILYLKTIELAQKYFSKVECGKFAADMKVDSVNDGPVTLLLNSREKFSAS